MFHVAPCFFSLCVVVLVVAVLSGLVTVAVAVVVAAAAAVFFFSPRRCCCCHPSTDPKVFVRPSVRPSVGSLSPGIVSRVSAVFQSAIANWLDGSLIRFLGS